MTPATHSGASSAAVPRLTRRQPVASAAASEASSRDAAGQLDLDLHGLGDLGDPLPVVAGAEGGVQIDQVQPLGSGALPGQRRLQRVAVGGLGAGLAVHQADGLPVPDVDGGQQFQPVARHVHGFLALSAHRDSIQFFSSCAPASPDFSGWNWVAHSGPFSTAETNRSACAVQLTTGGFRAGLAVSSSQSCTA